MSCVVSVLIPTHNRAELVGRCVESVLAHGVDGMEVVVANNGSTDGTRAVLDGIRDPRLRVLHHEKDIGIEQNFLSLLRAGSGEWVFFLTDDDMLLPSALDMLLGVARAHPAVGVVLSHAELVELDGTHVRVQEFHGVSRVFAAGLDALTVFVPAAHVLSRIFMRREWIDVQGVEATAGSLYPQMYMVGSIARNHEAFYLTQPTVAHTIDNPTDWSYVSDFMVGGRIALIKHLLPGARWRTEREALIDQIRDEIRVSHFPITAGRSVWAFVRHQAALLRIPDIALSRKYWRDLVSYVGGGGWRRVGMAFRR